MRKYTLLSVLLLAFTLTVLPQTGFSQVDTPNSSLFYPTNLDNISFTIGFEDQQRELRLDTDPGTVTLMDAEHMYGMLSCDLAPWITASAGLGNTKVNGDDDIGQQDSDKRREMWTVGVTAGLWGRTIFDPDFMACHTRVQAGLSHWSHNAKISDESIQWDELRASLILSTEVFAKEFGEDETMYPYSITFSIGGVYSDIAMDVEAPDQSIVKLRENDSQGFVAGIGLKIAHNLSLGWEARVFEKTSNSIKLAYHF
jgi:hypothetical protein